MQDARAQCGSVPDLGSRRRPVWRCVCKRLLVLIWLLGVLRVDEEQMNFHALQLPQRLATSIALLIDPRPATLLRMPDIDCDLVILVIRVSQGFTRAVASQASERCTSMYPAHCMLLVSSFEAPSMSSSTCCAGCCCPTESMHLTSLAAGHAQRITSSSSSSSSSPCGSSSSSSSSASLRGRPGGRFGAAPPAFDPQHALSSQHAWCPRQCQLQAGGAAL